MSPLPRMSIRKEEPFEDLDGDGMWDQSEFEDLNGNGVLDYDEVWFDLDADGIIDFEEPYNDINGNGIWDLEYYIMVNKILLVVVIMLQKSSCEINVIIFTRLLL